MVLFGACVMFLLIGVALGAVALWAVKLRPMEAEVKEARQDAKDAKQDVQTLRELFEAAPIVPALALRVDRLDTFMRPDNGDIAPRVAQLEKQVATDARTFRWQFEVHRKRCNHLDERLIEMAKTAVFVEPHRAMKTSMRPPAA